MNLHIRNSGQYSIYVKIEPIIPSIKARIKALALPCYIKVLAKPDPTIVPSAGIVLTRAMFTSYYLGVQSYFARQSGVQTFIYCPEVAAIIVKDITVRNLNISLRQGECIVTLAISAVWPFT